MLSRIGTQGFAVFFALMMGLQGSVVEAKTKAKPKLKIFQQQAEDSSQGDSLGDSTTAPVQTITRKSTNGQQNTTIVETSSGSGINAQTQTDVTVTAVPQKTNWLPMLMTVGVPLAATVLPMFMGGKDKDKKEESPSTDSTASDETDPTSNYVATPSAGAAADEVKDVADKAGDSAPLVRGAGIGSGLLDDDKDKKTKDLANDEEGPSAPIGKLNGSLKRCGAIPLRIKAALKESMDFRNNCSQTSAKSEFIAINDYSYQGSPPQPQMYIFDKNGNCLHQTYVTYGNGFSSEAGTGVGTWEKPKACSEGHSSRESDASTNGNAAPPGFHMTAPYTGSTWNQETALNMVGLEGQGSEGRLIRIHPTKNPGAGASLGCTGVGEESVREVVKLLGSGSLVYNFFGENPTQPEGCKCAQGFGPHRGSACVPDHGKNGCSGTSSFDPAAGAGGSSGAGGIDGT